MHKNMYRIIIYYNTALVPHDHRHHYYPSASARTPRTTSVLPRINAAAFIFKVFHDLGVAFIRGWRFYYFKQPTVTLL